MASSTVSCGFKSQSPVCFNHKQNAPTSGYLQQQKPLAGALVLVLSVTSYHRGLSFGKDLNKHGDVQKVNDTVLVAIRL